MTVHSRRETASLTLFKGNKHLQTTINTQLFYPYCAKTPISQQQNSQDLALCSVSEPFQLANMHNSSHLTDSGDFKVLFKLG